MHKTIRTVGDGLLPLGSKTIFLAGPIERKKEDTLPKLPRWRDEAMELLLPENLCFYNPEWLTKPANWSYTLQVQWEVEALHRAHCILCWIPRQLPLLPAFTTNVEVGEWLHAEKLIVGAPVEASHTRYIRTRRSMLGLPWYSTLEECCLAVAAFLKKGKTVA